MPFLGGEEDWDKLSVKDAKAVEGFVFNQVEKKLVKNNELLAEVRREAAYLYGDKEEMIKRFQRATGKRKFA